MSLVVLRYIAMIFGPSITATARPATTLLAIQITVVALVHRDLATVPAGFEALMSIPAMGVVALLAGLEIAAAHDPDIAAILRDLNVDQITGAFGALSCGLFFATLGMPESETMALTEGAAGSAAASGGLLNAAGEAAGSEHSLGVQALVLGFAVALNIGLTWMRAQLLAFVYEFELSKIWARIETGGIIALLILLPLFPLVILGVMLILACGLTVFSLSARTAVQVMDQRSRTSCDGCGHELRVEASLCPECGVERQPSGKPTTGWRAAVAAIKGK